MVRATLTRDDHVEHEEDVLPGRLKLGHIRDVVPHLLVPLVIVNNHLLHELHCLVLSGLKVAVCLHLQRCLQSFEPMITLPSFYND